MVSIPAYRPVIRTTRGPYRAAALVGTHSISIGWDVDPAHKDGLHGFALRKSEVDPVSGEVIAVNWLRGEKRFNGDPVDGYDVSSREAPFQRFRWSDYTLKSSLGYVFDIFPVRGAPPDGLTINEPPLTLKLRPSPEMASGVGAFVNRGVTSAFAYLDRFKGAHPRDVPDGAAWRWLSRGLKEALIGFIEGAGGGHGLRVGIYEFFDDEVAAALAAAKARGVDVRIVYHAKPGDHATHKSEAVLAAHGLTAIATPRAAIQKISHNKFIVHLVGGVPVRTFTGTANFSENAFYYQTNAAVILDDPVVAAAYHDYWLILADDPARGPSKSDPAEVRNRVGALQARLAAAGGGPFTTQYFSPVRTLDIIDKAVAMVGTAKSCVLTSAPFALDPAIVAAIAAQPKELLHYGLANTTVRKKVEALTTNNTRYFVPSRLETYMGRQWDAKAFGNHKIHSKLMIIDPFGAKPQMLFGSANFSDESCQGNDENAFLSEDPRLIAIMATEFLRMFDHYKSRAFINQIRGQGLTDDDYLSEDGGWMRSSFSPTARSHKFRDRLVFVGD